MPGRGLRSPAAPVRRARAVAQIADAAGLSRQALYLRFKSKAGLLHALLDHIAETRGLAEMTDDVRQAPTAIEALNRAVRLHSPGIGRAWSNGRSGSGKRFRFSGARYSDICGSYLRAVRNSSRSRPLSPNSTPVVSKSARISRNAGRSSSGIFAQKLGH